MLIRRNTKAFKSILEIVESCRDRADREDLIRLYITRAGDTIGERIPIEGIEGDKSLFYDMTFQTVLGNLRSSDHQLYQSDDVRGIYFFHSSSNKTWDETPFEFDDQVKKAFASVDEPPVTRKKEKAEKFAIPTAKTEPAKKSGTTATKEKKHPAREKAARSKGESAKEKSEPVKERRIEIKAPVQPAYKLRRDIHFTGLDRIAYRQPQLTKRDVLDYYNNISEYLLPWLKDRPQIIHIQRDGNRGSANADLESLRQNSALDVPAWVQTTTVKTGRHEQQLLLINDREHLLLYVELGCLEFFPCHSRIKSIDSPDYIVIAIESPEYELAKAIDVALAAREIFDGLHLPSFAKTDGASALHIYIPLDSKSGFDAARDTAGYLCKLIRIKAGDRAVVKGGPDDVYGKVTLDYLLNDKGKAVIAPYSLAANSSATVATPLLWEDLTEQLSAGSFNHVTTMKKLKDDGDPFDAFYKKKENADALLERMEANYGFLF
jgi:bifunctional non-homologous end joining protein LigD